MGVKTIFKVLIGTIVVIVFSMLFIELLNVLTYSAQMNQMIRVSTKKACYLFCNETYRKDIGLLSNIHRHDGSVVVGGNIYGALNEQKEIYESLYKNNTNFENWYRNEGTGIWDNLDILAVGLGISTKSLSAEDTELAKYFADSLVTPINIGVTYLDEDIVAKILRWNLTAILYNGQKEMLLTNENGENYVKYKGFRVYSTAANILIDYEILDLTLGDDRIKLRNATRIDDLDLMKFDNDKVMLAGVRYEVPIEYEGITPLGEIIKFTSNNRVEGLSSTSGTSINREQNIERATLKGGGLEGRDNIPLSGRLTFMVAK